MRDNKRYCFGERGINLRGLPAGSGIPDIIRQQSWEGFIETRHTFCPRTVIDFYVSMSPPVYHDRWVVKMGNIDVRISPADINAYYRTPHRPELSATYGLAPHPAFQVNMNPMIAASLRRNGYEGWNNASQTILKSEMHTDFAFLMLFIKASLKPSTHNTTADSQVAEVLYSLQHNLPIDVGHIIWMEILDAGMTFSGILPFPCLITHFCREAGVPIGPLTSTKKDFTKTQYQHQLTAQAKLEVRRRADPDHQRRMLAMPVHDSSDSASDSSSEADPDFNPEAPQAAAYEHSDDTPQYMRHFMDHITTQVSGINVNMERGFQGVNRRLDGHDTRLDSIDYRLNEAGYPEDRRRVRGRQSGGASSSHQ